MRLEPKSTDAKSQTRAIALASLSAVAFTLLIVSLLVIWAGVAAALRAVPDQGWPRTGQHQAAVLVAAVQAGE